MPFEIIPLIVDAVEGAVLGSGIGGSVAEYCNNNPHVARCANKRDILNTEGIPRMQFARQDTGPCNVPQYNFDLCHDQLAGVHIDSSIPAPGEARFDGVPPACMVLATTLTGACGASGPGVFPCGSACLYYTQLTDEELATLSSAIKGK
ncbi:hypothetical protein ONZ43_g4610 [Nemania bipapillata]|uniref:Uncharacterized protein n=1 Tax=Nemania bipapillata TaxID=110536 RepID=A0ACC2IKH0_9PEZI|nr:hypothetical protein ONZ43_g4610 [Nemania bipapillata]